MCTYMIADMYDCTGEHIDGVLSCGVLKNIYTHIFIAKTTGEQNDFRNKFLDCGWYHTFFTDFSSPVGGYRILRRLCVCGGVVCTLRGLAYNFLKKNMYIYYIYF